MILIRRHGNTGKEMVESGQWVKVGKKHYRHVSGAEVKFDWNSGIWIINDQKHGWGALWVARHEVEAGRIS